MEAVELTLKKVEPGLYQSTDGRVIIRKVASHGYRGMETCWTLAVDGAWVCDRETKRECEARARRRLAGSGSHA